MTKILTGSQLYEFIQQKSASTKQILWICSPQLGFQAHEIFPQQILNNPPNDIKFILKTTQEAIKKGQTNPYELQFLLEHFKECKIISNDNFNLNTYIFDDSGLITSAYFTKNAFEKGFEIGATIEGQYLAEVKNLFEIFWQTGKPIGDLKKLKQTWNTQQKNENNDKKTKQHTAIKQWIPNATNSWFLATTLKLPVKVERKIKKEANWTNTLSILGDIGFQTYRELKIGDFGYIIDLKTCRGNTVNIELARIFDKTRVETDLGDYHLAYQTEKNHLLDRGNLNVLITKMGKRPRNCELKLTQEQHKQLTDTLSTVKIKKKKQNKKTLEKILYSTNPQSRKTLHKHMYPHEKKPH